MIELWTTKTGSRQRNLCRIAAALVVVLTCVTSCGPTEQATPLKPDSAQTLSADHTETAVLPVPDSDRLDYNKDTRVLTFYDPPETARWMVLHPGDRFPVAVGPEHRLPSGIDAANTFVYYATSGGKHSSSVTLQQIQEGRGLHVSAARN